MAPTHLPTGASFPLPPAPVGTKDPAGLGLRVPGVRGGGGPRLCPARHQARAQPLRPTGLAHCAKGLRALGEAGTWRPPAPDARRPPAPPPRDSGHHSGLPGLAAGRPSLMPGQGHPVLERHSVRGDQPSGSSSRGSPLVWGQGTLGGRGLCSAERRTLGPRLASWGTWGGGSASVQLCSLTQSGVPAARGPLGGRWEEAAGPVGHSRGAGTVRGAHRPPGVAGQRDPLPLGSPLGSESVP